jgi:two-component system phosphate regulon response regulator OmpR
VKPFEPQELLLRLRAILRRARSAVADGGAAAPRAVQLGRVRFDLEGMRLSAGAAAVHLTAAEARLLKQLAERPGEVLSRDDLAEQGGGGARNIDVQVTRLRRKIEPDPRYPRYLQTVRGRGYVLRPD